MDWYYAAGGEQKGPFSQAEFDELIRTGAVTSATLVWREAMAEWQPYGQLTKPVAPPPPAPAVAEAAQVVCSECGRGFRLDQTIRLGSGFVCADCKGVALQKLREGVTGGAAEQIRQEHLKHEASVKSVGILYFLAAILVTIYALAALTMGRFVGPNTGSLLGVFCLVIAGLQIWVGIGLRKLKPWARIPAGILSGFGLLSFPIGTLINAYILYLIFSAKGKTVFTAEYKRVIEETPHIKYKTSIIVWIALGMLIFLIGSGVLAALVGRSH